VVLTDEEEATRDALQAEYDRIEATYADAEELPDDADQRLGEIETALAAFDERPVRFELSDIARAGAFISIDGGGHLRVERGFVRPEDEAPVQPDLNAAAEPDPSQAVPAQVGIDGEAESANPTGPTEADEDESLKPIPDRLMTELTVYRTLALRQALGEQPDIAFLATSMRCASGSFIAMRSTPASNSI
jgi:ParB family transcriptional regulator, chromosome partitioning protein